MYTITFYSFKGGVGRTMALVNVAAQLAKMGRKVLVVDFDLEAPGLETFERLRPLQPHPGLVEYVTEYMSSKRSPDVRDYIYPVSKIGKKDGQLWVMLAGRRDRDYHLALSRLDWRKLYDDCEGFLFFEDLKAQWEQEYKPDYVLIDSRTGHTDVKGICTRQLPDAVVMFFFPNEQNLVGLKGVCEEIRLERIKGLQKNIRLHVVMSNVPDLDDEDRHLHRHLSEFRKALNVPHAPVPIIHRNETLQMLDQPVFVLQRPRSRLAAEYRLLARALQIENPEDRDGASLFLKEVQKERSRLLDLRHYDWRWAWFTSKRRSQGDNGGLDQRLRRMPDAVSDRVDRITVQFWNDADILFRVGQYFSPSKPSIAVQRFNRALVLKPDFAEALFERAFSHRRLRDDAAAAEDLLRYLRDYGSQEPDWDHLDMQSKFRIVREAAPYGITDERYFDIYASNPLYEQYEVDPYEESENEKKIWMGRKKNEIALLELLSISLDEFMKTLDLPPLQIPRGTSHDPSWLLNSVTERLLQQRHWEEAIRWLEHLTVKRIVDEPRYIAFHAFYLAMAHWGKAGEPNRELSSQAILAFQPLMDTAPSLWGYELFQPFQAYSLLSWGAGDIAGAASALDGANKNLDDVSVIYWVSFWSFQETTWRECRQDCEEMRRMIEGEPIRPTFLGSPKVN